MATDALVNGTYLVLGEVSGDVADKQGVASVTVPVIVPDLPTAFSVNPDDVQAAVGIFGFACLGRPFHQIEGALYQVNFKFEGVAGNASLSQSETNTQWDFDLEMENAPIQTHPSFQSLKDTYNWSTTGADGSPGFAETWSGAKGANGGLPGGQNNTQPNPLFGTTDWLKIGGIYSRSYGVTSVPSSIYQALGTLIPVPPDAQVLGITSFPGRAWFVMAPKVTRRNKSTGPARITERYRLTGQDLGAAKIIYAQGQLDQAGS
ncbi:MAG TPA: hypothetical protein VGM54_09925 [Chthoniobacter sp.]|jgi:hypothetical protein